MMREEETKGLVERVTRLEERFSFFASSSLLTPIAWMRWIPAVLLAVFAVEVIFLGARIVLLPLLGSIALAYLLLPVAEWFENHGWSRSVSALLAVMGAVLLIVLALIFLLPGIWVQLLKSYDQGRELLADQARVERALQIVNQASPPLYDYLNTTIESYRNPVKQAELRGRAADWLQRGLFGLVNMTSSLLSLFLIPFFAFCMLSSHHQVRARIEQLTPPRYRQVVNDLILQLSRVLSTYVRNQMLISTAMGLLYGIGLTMLRVPLGFTIGMLTGVLNFIPYLVMLTGLTLSLLFAILDGAGFGRTFGVLGVFIAVQALDGYYLTPRLMGGSLNLHPMWMLLGLMIGGNLFGLFGVILAVPVIATSKVIFDFLEEIYQRSAFYRRPGAELLTDRGAPVEMIISPTNVSASIASTEEPVREPRVVITTGELRYRPPRPPSE